MLWIGNHLHNPLGEDTMSQFISCRTLEMECESRAIFNIECASRQYPAIAFFPPFHSIGKIFAYAQNYAELSLWQCAVESGISNRRENVRVEIDDELAYQLVREPDGMPSIANEPHGICSMSNKPISIVALLAFYAMLVLFSAVIRWIKCGNKRCASDCREHFIRSVWDWLQ